MAARWLTNNLGLKLVSLFLAVILWFYASGEEREEVVKNIPIRFEAPSETMTVLDSSLQSIKVTMSVPRNLLSVISSADLSAHHKIKNVEAAGEYTFIVNRKDLKLPPGNIQVTKIEPEVVTIVLDELITVKLPIKPNFSGEPAIGYAVDADSIILDPNAALIEGPKSKVEEMKAVLTEPIDLVGRTRSFRKRIGLMLDPDVRSAVEDLKIDIYVPLKEEFSDIEVADVPVSFLGSPGKAYEVRLDPTSVTVSLKGPLADLKALDISTILAYVNVQGLKPGSHNLPLEMKLPPDISLKGEPPIINVTIEKLKR